MRVWKENGDVGLVYETFGNGRARLYQQSKRFDPGDLGSLRDRSAVPGGHVVNEHKMLDNTIQLAYKGVVGPRSSLRVNPSKNQQNDES